MWRSFFVLLALPLALLAAGCGGGGGGNSLDQKDAAVVNGQHITRSSLDERMHQAACSYRLQKKVFPKAGSQEYQQIQTTIIQNLVQRVQLEQKAPSLDVKVTDKQVEDQLKNLKKQYFGGSEKRYLAELKKQCVTDAGVRDDLRSNLLSNAIFKKVTGNAKVTDAEVRAYFDSHRQVYTTPQTREVRHILVKNKALADRLYAQLKSGADFTTLVKKYTIDPGSKSTGGKYTVTRNGSFVKPFEDTAYALKTGEISKPIHTKFGWHIIQALKPATPHKSTPFAQVKESIKQQLLQQKQSTAVKTWIDGLKKEYASKISYAGGLAPTTSTAATTTG
jgi:parvulin-like peptidyl-prolyl isomerase